MKQVMGRFKWGFAFVTTLLGAGVCNAGPITYNINQVIGEGSVTGIIRTSGATGVLGVGDITSFNLDLMGAGGSNFNLTNFNSTLFVVGNDLTATAAHLDFNFSGSDAGYFIFELSSMLSSGAHYFCDATITQNSICAPSAASVVPESVNDPSAQFAVRTGNQIIGRATVTVPEPDTLLLLSLGLAGVVLTWRRKQPA